jgi:hypothetical protein
MSSLELAGILHFACLECAEADEWRRHGPPVIPDIFHVFVRIVAPRIRVRTDLANFTHYSTPVAVLSRPRNLRPGNP